ncbi:MAG TPA: hypothetical protein PLY58_04180 [Bacilli bacterium]|nr:hypothetical protein [Bacilli bacterium]HQA56247.1 hypothetical protein [Bacilli bacterium]
MKKIAFLLPLMALLLVGCGNNDNGGGGGDGDGDGGGGNNPTYHLVAEYDFTTNGHTATGTELTADTAKTLFADSLSDGTDKISSVSDLAKVFDGNSTGGAYANTSQLVKMGTSSVDGAFTLNLVSGTNIKRVVVSAFDWYKKTEPYPVNTNSLLVNGDSQLAPYNEAGTPGDLTYDLATATDTLAFQADGAGTDGNAFGRVFLFSIALYSYN